ncbi:FAD-containing oxidoreductase [Caulobacter sp. KR2-114]|uniref:FAD-containing oxidoreductase n=1 Tax=Caulobacter sp. KR2-114 TaxID=3400912 RepID=UPI003C09D0D2
MSRHFDALIIGAGQSGPFLAVKLANAGRQVALVERKGLGGTCVNNGCIPTKTLIASARVARDVRQAGDYGVKLQGGFTVDMAAVKARKDGVVNASIDGLESWVAATDNLTLIRSEARFTGPRTLDAGGETLTADQVFIDTGGRPVIPDWAAASGVACLTNLEMMDLDVLPGHLLIVGGSYIGLEFAQMYRRFGAPVTVVEYGDRLIGREDPEVSDAVRAMVEAEGVKVLTGARDFALEKTAAGARLTLTSHGAPVTLEGSHVLLAVGRKPNVESLDLAAGGVALDARGYIQVDDQLRTTADGVWAMGDVNGHGAFTHTSYNDFEIVAANLLNHDERRLSQRIPCYALFTDPPLARIGKSEAEVRATGRPALVATLPMTRVGRARERGETTGFMKVLADAETKLILGASLFCIEGDEAIHSLLDVMAAGLPYTVIQRTMHIHPTVSELIPTLLEGMQPLV